MLRTCRSAIVPSLLMLCPGIGLAQSTPAYPARPVTLVVPLAPGGPVEFEMRLYAPKLQELLGQPFVTEFKLGAAGTIAGAYVAKAAPDGYTLLIVNNAFTTFPGLYKNLSFDVEKDFAPVTLMTKRPVVLLATPSFPPKNFAEYMAYAKANPGRINWGTTGAGAGGHLSGSWLHGATNTRVTFIHYKGTGDAMPDLMSGRLDVTGVGLGQALPLIKSGKLKPIVMLAERRSTLLPELVTVAEQAIPGYDYGSYTGLFAPGATAPAIVNRLNEAMVKVLKLPEIRNRLEADGNEVVGNTPAQFRQMIVTETNSWRKVVQEAGISLSL